MAKFILGSVLERKSITKYRFAKLTGEEYRNIWRYFRPGYDPKLSKLAKFAKALKVKIRDLYEE